MYTRDNPWTGRSGVAAYCRDLTPALERRGHRVIHAFSEERTWALGAGLHSGTKGHTPFISIRNSPLHPAYSISNPTQDVEHGTLERLFRSLLGAAHPDLVHFHTLIGLPATTLLICKEMRVPVAVTFHDFWVSCPRVLLVRPDGSACPGPEEGLNCVRFCAHPLAHRRRVYRWLAAILPSGAVRDRLSRLRQIYALGEPAGRSEWASPPPPQELDAQLRHRADAFSARQQMLLSILRDADALLTVSEFVSSVLVSHGFPAGGLTTLPLGLRVTEWVRRSVKNARRPVRFGFLGRMSPLKGAHILAQAARQFTSNQATFQFWGPASVEVRAALRALAGPRAALTFRGPYRREDLGAVLGEIDVVVVPSLAQETVGLAALEAQAAGCPVIASRIGALPEWVRHGENGLLVDSGSVDDLARALKRVVDEPDLVATWSAATTPPPSVDQHAEALLQIYHRVHRTVA